MKGRNCKVKPSVWMGCILPILLALVISMPPTTEVWAHKDGDNTKIGEYRVVLNTLKVLVFDDNGPLGIEEEAPDLFIKTFTQAETHVGQTAAFGEYEDTVVGREVPIGKLIYWHLDCPSSEKLSLIVDVADRDDGALAGILKAALATGGGILTTKQPQAKPAVDAATQALNAAIDKELKASDLFPQFSSQGFTIDDNAGTLVRQSGSQGVVGLDAGEYEVSATFQYIERDCLCTDANIFGLEKTIASGDPEVKGIIERLTRDAAESGKKTSKGAERPGPLARLDYAIGEADLSSFTTAVRGDEVLVNLGANIDEPIAFYIFGAAATAFKNRTKVVNITIVTPRTIYQSEKESINTFLDVPKKEIGTGNSILALFDRTSVRDNHTT